MSKLWSEQELEYLRENFNKKSIQELMIYFGRTLDAVQLRANRIGLKSNVWWSQNRFVDFVRENSNDEYEVIGNFVSVGEKILLRHKICNKIWETTPSSFIYAGNRCLNCSKTRSPTQEEFIDKVKKVNDKIEILGKYYNQITNILCRCLVDGYEWMARPVGLLDGVGCPLCSNHKYRTHEEFIKDVLKINPNILVLGKFVGVKSKISVRCLIDNYEWITNAGNLLGKSGCPRCGGVSKYSSIEFKNKMKDVNPDIEVIGDYADHYTKIKVICLKDGYEWMATPHTLLNKVGCPCCSNSKGERECVIFFNKYNIDFSSQFYFKDLKGTCGLPLKFDHCIKSNESICCLIEVDGIGHRKPIKFKGMSEEDAIRKFEIIKHHDNLKNEYCIKNNIKLIRIFYTGKNFKEIIKILEKELIPLLKKEVNNIDK